MHLSKVVPFILCLHIIFLPGLCFSAPKNVEGWQQLKWGDDIDKIKKFYKGKIKKTRQIEKNRFPIDEEHDAAYVMRHYYLLGVNFSVYFIMNKENKLAGVILLTNADDYIFQSDFEYVENILKRKYGAPLRSGDHSLKNCLYYRRIWSFQSTNIELTYFYDKEAVNFASQARLRLTTSGIFKTNIQIVYSKNEAGSNTGKVSKTIQEAMARAEEAGKLTDGKFTYEVTFSDERVYFAFDRSGLSDRTKLALDVFAEGLKEKNNNVYLEIQGHTDSIGGEDYNLKLGRARSESVMHYLHTEHGFPPNRMKAVSYGEYRPVVDNNTSRNRAKNRRVKIVDRETAP